jgi:cytochrome c551
VSLKTSTLSILTSRLSLACIPLVLIVAAFQQGCHKETYSQGEILYRIHCENCHMEDGSGLGRLIPPLDSSRLTLSDPEKLICLIRNGKPANPLTGQKMPANAKINEVELTNLVNFLGSRYASNPQTVQVPEVKKMLSGCQTD